MRQTFLLGCLIAAVGVAPGVGCSTGASDASGGGGAGGGDVAPLAKPAIGMQIQTAKITLAPGAEQYSCWSFVVPEGEPISLVSIENQIPTKGVHHYAVFTNSDPKTEDGPYDCETMGISWGLVSGGGVGTPGVTFPAGTAMPIPAGQHIIFQLHLLNPSTKSIDVEPAYINLVGTNETNLQQVGLLIAGTLDIAIPAQSTGVTVSGGCTLDEPMAHIFETFPHMHQLGRRITAAKQTGTASPVMLSDQQWDFSDQGLYPVEGSADVGDQITVSCTYDNPSDAPVNFGLSTKDEMCVNVLYYYPATQPSKYCGIGD